MTVLLMSYGADPSLRDGEGNWSFIPHPHVRIQRGGPGVQDPPPLKNHKNQGFF